MTKREKNRVVSPTIRGQAALAEAGGVAETEIEWLGAYYVVDHAACGNDRLLNTQADAIGFIGNAAPFQKQNFLYGDPDVRTEDFVAATDRHASGSRPTGEDGIDSVVVAYIATHGGRAGSSFVFNIGSQNGVCRTIANTNMSLGEGKLRYLFLSTCESVSKAAPGNVWFRAAKGLRAVFGYDGTIKDSPDYGKLFFDEWKKPAATTTQAFLDASWRVSHDQIAVAAWFGSSKPAAANARDHESHFQHDRVVAKFVSYRWHGLHPLFISRSAVLHVSNTRLMFNDPSPDSSPLPVLERLLGEAALQGPLERSQSGDYFGVRTKDGTLLLRNARSGSLDLTFQLSGEPSPLKIADGEVVASATEYVSKIREAIPGLRTTAPGLTLGLTPTGIRNSYAGTYEEGEEPPPPEITEATVIFRQTVNGIPTIGTGGVVEVTLNQINDALQVRRVRTVTREVAVAIHQGLPFQHGFQGFQGFQGFHVGHVGHVVTSLTGSHSRDESSFNLPALESKAELRALSEHENSNSQCDIVRTDFGFYAADEAEQQGSSDLSFRVLVQVTTGQFARRYEKIYTVSELL